MKTALITGATSGIGKATAELFAENNIQLIITGRRTDRLQELKETLGKKVPVHTLEFDVRDKVKVNDLLTNLPKEFSDIDYLINNAGNAHGLDSIQNGNIEDWDAMMDINVKGLLYVSQPIIKKMIAKGSGYIINIGSTAGKEVYAKGNVYCGSKHAVDAITEGMRVDLIETGVKVSQLCPGLVETEFSDVRFKGDTEKAKTVYQGFKALQANDIAELLLFMITRPAHVNLADCVILPAAQANAYTVHKT